MSEYVVKLPDVGEGIAEAEIVEWHVNVGDTIAEDQLMVEVMTDKATVELPSPVTGVVTSVGAAVGEILQVGSPLIRIETNGTTGASDGQATTTALPTPTPAPAEVSHDEAQVESPAEPPDAPDAPDWPGSAAPTADTAVAPAPAPDRRSAPTAAPAVRQRATTLGLDLADVAGTGPDGRVVHADLDNYLASARPAAATIASTDDAIDAVPVIGLRRNIAQRMQLAKEHIPHFTYVEEVDVTEIERLRAQLNEHQGQQQLRLTVLPFLMRAVVVAIADFPQMNARYDDDNGVVNRHRAIHLGVATQTAKGLMVPVVTNAQSRDLWDAAAEVARLATAARTHAITLQELTGSTITISSLGSLGGIVSTPIINYPEVAMLGVGRITDRPWAYEGQLALRKVAQLGLTFDHRVCDGAAAGGYLRFVADCVESPASMLAFL
jgi:2-oxoisovalerate dehydrogenase E2 component (dihydrolipoyl transacylase)